MRNGKDLLVEIGCEELPASCQHQLAESLCSLLIAELTTAGLDHSAHKTFATPRRVAVLIENLDVRQPPKKIERMGPNATTAYNKDGTPTIACMGFASSCGVSTDQLFIKKTDKADRVAVSIEQPGTNTRDLLPQLIEKTISKLHLTKTMRWGDSPIEFIRPVHWVVILFGPEPISMQLLGQAASNITYGHRFLHPGPIKITMPHIYEEELYSKGFVLANFAKRKHFIKQHLPQDLSANQKVVLDEDLLNEVTSLVEWPVILRGSFDKEFLQVPGEVLITAMQTHQKCFAIRNNEGQLEPAFLLVSNIASQNKDVVIQGNEHVIRARLSDAQFFYNNDLTISLANRGKQLQSVIFQEKLGTLEDKTKRIAKLAGYIAKQLNINADLAKRAGTLAKCDLVSEMVGEFPKLQGLMGYYYALHGQEDPITALAIKEHYQPRFAGDALPSELTGCALALADKLDTLIGIIGIKQLPTGDKDPFALRRAAIGIIRIIIEKELQLDLTDLLQQAQKGYTMTLPNNELIPQTLEFFNHRLKAWYLEQGVKAEVFQAVAANHITIPYDFDRRIKAVQHFQTLPQANALSAANKRVANILKKQKIANKRRPINKALLEIDAEQQLVDLLSIQEKAITQLYHDADYESTLAQLATLKEPIDLFFDEVMIMDKDQQKRDNRLAILLSIHHLFTQVADISLLTQDTKQAVKN